MTTYKRPTLLDARKGNLAPSKGQPAAQTQSLAHGQS
jgi:hypothetical protein